jgi:hypothetical protein
MARRQPSQRRKARAGVIVVALVFLIAAAIFVGLNLQHARELKENPPPPSPLEQPSLLEK